MSRAVIGRRSVLAGLGASVALPALEAMRPRSAHAQTAAPKRLALYYVPNGWPHGYEYDGPYQAGVQALQDMRQDFTTIWGLTNQAAIEHEELHGAHDGHGKTATTVMTGQVPSDLGNQLYGVPTTADQVIAKQIYGNMKFPSLGTNIYPVGSIDSFHQPIHTNDIFWKGPNDPVKLYTDPAEMFDLMFAGTQAGAMPDPLAQARRARKKSILDFVMSDITAVEATVSAADRHRLDEYLTSLRKVESNIDAISGSGAGSVCQAPAAPRSLQTSLDTYVERYDAMHDLMVKAFECDLTRIFQFMVGNETHFPSYVPGISNDWHSYSHDDYGGTRSILAWHLGRYKRLVQRLKATVDIDGKTLFDNSTVVFFSAQGDSGSHVVWNLQAFVAGRGGANYKLGQDFKHEADITSLWLTFMRDHGVVAPSYGKSSNDIAGLRG